MERINETTQRVKAVKQVYELVKKVKEKWRMNVNTRRLRKWEVEEKRRYIGVRRKEA